MEYARRILFHLFSTPVRPRIEERYMCKDYVERDTLADTTRAERYATWRSSRDT
jgi:hypothetical protein